MLKIKACWEFEVTCWPTRNSESLEKLGKSLVDWRKKTKKTNKPLVKLMDARDVDTSVPIFAKELSQFG
jgi:hypothetical protein